MSEMDNKVLIGIFGAIAGCYGWLIKHLMNSKNVVTKDEFAGHKKSVQYKDVCKANRDCMETKIDGLKELIEQRFDSLEELVKNGGKK